MNSDEILNNLKKAMRLEIEVRKVNRFMIHTGFTYPDGDELHILLIDDGGKWKLTDEGHTMMWASYGDGTIGSEECALNGVLNANGVKLLDGELYVIIGNDTLECIGTALRSLIQTEIQIAGLSHYTSS